MGCTGGYICAFRSTRNHIQTFSTCSVLLRQLPKKIIEIFEMAKKVYSWRSKVVHGSNLRKLSETESAKIVHEVKELVRKALILAGRMTLAL
jgi:hypothetical protein